MALKATIFKANLQIADIEHSYYADHALTLARHPSETDERMMVRLVALALQAHQLQSVCNGDGTLSFGAGLSDPEEPDAWLRDFTGRTRLWIEVGQPEDKPLLKACARADAVVGQELAVVAEIHRRGRGGGGGFTEVERAHSVGSRVIGHDEPAAAEVSGRRMGNRQRHRGRDGRVDGVAAPSQNVATDFRRVLFLGHDHMAREDAGGRHWLRSVGGGGQAAQQGGGDECWKA